MLKRFASNSLFYLLAMVLNRGISFVLLPIYTRHLTPADYGILAICTTIITLLGSVLSLSLEGSAIVYYFKLDRPEFRKLLRTVWLWMLFAPLPVIGALQFLGPRVLTALLPQVPWQPYLSLTVWIAYLSIAPLLPLAMLRSQQKAFAYGVLSVASFLVTALLLLYFVAVREEGVLGSLRAQIISGALVAVVSHSIIFQRYQLLPWRWWELSWKYLRAALRLCVPYLPHVFFMWALNLSDRWILVRFVPLSELGIYNLAYTLGMLVLVVGMALLTAYDPFYYQGAAEEGFRAQLPRLLGGYFLISTLIMLSASLLAPEVLRLMTRPAYYAAARLVPWIAMGYWFYVGIYGLSMTVLTYHKRTEWTLLLTGPPALLNIALNWILIPRYGILAAAVNTLVAFMAMALLGLLVSRRLDRLPYPWMSLIGMLVAAGFAYWLGDRWLTFPQLGLALVSKGALLTVAGLVMVRLAGFRSTEIRALKDRAQQRLPWYRSRNPNWPS